MARSASATASDLVAAWPVRGFALTYLETAHGSIIPPSPMPRSTDVVDGSSMIGMQAWIAELDRLGRTPEQNRAALAGEPNSARISPSDHGCLTWVHRGIVAVASPVTTARVQRQAPDFVVVFPFPSASRPWRRPRTVSAACRPSPSRFQVVRRKPAVRELPKRKRFQRHVGRAGKTKTLR